MKIYVAASSAEINRARNVIYAVRNRTTLEITYDWVASIERHGNANIGLSEEAKAQESKASVLAAVKSDFFWLLLPNTPTRGAYVELGAFLGSRTLYDHFRPLIVSGSEEAFEASIFHARADRVFLTDLQALTWLTHGWGRSINE